MAGSATPPDGADVMAAIDAAEFVIADVGCDDAWLSMPEAHAPILDDWR
ncbi:MAG: hypothetical protein ABEJ34_09205 [Haloferacaceae archaeon]